MFSEIVKPLVIRDMEGNTDPVCDQVPVPHSLASFSHIGFPYGLILTEFLSLSSWLVNQLKIIH